MYSSYKNNIVRFGPIGLIQFNDLLESSISKTTLTTNSGNLYKIGTANTNGINYVVYLFTTSTDTPATANSATDTYKIDYSCATSSNLCYVFAVGGGGGGSSYAGAGGGGGGVVMMPVTLPSGSTTITVSVGNGGRASAEGGLGGKGYNSYVNFSGSTSSSNNIIAYGGGYGSGTSTVTAPSSGGSSGGANNNKSGTGNNSDNNFANGTPTFTSSMGSASAQGGGGGGGGGAGASPSINTSNGGEGIACTIPGIKDYTPTSKSNLGSYFWAGGGGGSSFTGININGGKGGGGGGSNYATGGSQTGGVGFNNGTAGAISNGVGGSGGANTGGGGGGTWNAVSGAGGSGVVAIAFPVIKESLLIRNYNFATPSVSSNSASTVNINLTGWSVSGAGSYYILNGTGGATYNLNACPYGNFFYTTGNIVLSQTIPLNANTNYTLLFSAAVLSSFTGTFTITIGSNSVSSTTLSITNANIYWNTYTWNFTNVTAGSYTLTFNFNCPIGITQILINDQGYSDGLIYKSYATNNTYNSSSPNNALSYFTGATQTSSGTTNSINYSNSSFNTLDTYTQSSSIPINFAVSFSGYFIPTSTGLWTFTFYGDDTLSFWLGTAFQTTSNLLSTVTISSINNAIVLSSPITVTPLSTLFTSSTLTLSAADYKSGIYTISASSYYHNDGSLAPYIAFNGTTTASWCSDDTTAATSYNNTGVYIGTTTTAISNNAITSLTGEWLGIKLPYSMIIRGYTLMPRYGSSDNSIPQKWYVIASNDNVIWNIVDYQNLSITNYTTLQTYTITGQTTAYSYFRIVILNKLSGGNGWTSLSQFNLNGFPSVNSTYSVNLTDRTPYPMLLNYGQGANNAKCQMGITPPSGTLTNDGTPYFFNK